MIGSVPRRRSFLTALATTLVLALPLVALPLAPPAWGSTPYSSGAAVVTKRVIGHSVTGRPIVAYRLGEPGRPVAVAISAMHGNEARPRLILEALRDGTPIVGVDLWVIPTYNPDGVARGTRKNARGVDLNRNFPYHWADLDGSYESGPRAGSEPETRAVMRFLRTVQPRWIVSFHQPLNGVDLDTKNRRFAARLADKLHLPRKVFDCGGVCHGTMTGWYNHHFAGSAVTVEYRASETRYRMKVAAPRQLLAALGARFRSWMIFSG